MCQIPEFKEITVDYNKHMLNEPCEIDTREEVDNILLGEAIEEVLNTLTEREKQVIINRIYYKYTLDKAGIPFKISIERTRQIEQRGLRKLRHPLRAKKLYSFFSHEDYEEKYQAGQMVWERLARCVLLAKVPV